MMSIRPKYVEKILNGEKTIEIRKKFPSDYVGWVYIYCTKQNDLFKSYIRMGYYTTRSTADDLWYNGKGKVVARFWCDKVEEIKIYEGEELGKYFTFTKSEEKLLKTACLTKREMWEYVAFNSAYAINITKLEIFDKPKELSEFKHLLKGNKHDHSIDAINIVGGILLTKAPQSWCWVEERKDL